MLKRRYSGILIIIGAYTFILRGNNLCQQKSSWTPQGLCCSWACGTYYSLPCPLSGNVFTVLHTQYLPSSLWHLWITLLTLFFSSLHPCHFLLVSLSFSTLLPLEIPLTLETIKISYLWMNLKCISPALTSPSHSNLYISSILLEIPT